MVGSGHSSRHGPRDVGMAYLLWAASFVGIAGLHRFYTGRWVTGLLYLFTFGIFGVGTFVDLFLIPNQVRSFNHESNARMPKALTGLEFLHPRQRKMPLRQRILVLARHRGTRGFTLNDAVIDLGLPPKEIRSELEYLMKEDCLHITNDMEGRIIYREP